MSHQRKRPRTDEPDAQPIDSSTTLSEEAKAQQEQLINFLCGPAGTDGTQGFVAVVRSWLYSAVIQAIGGKPNYQSIADPAVITQFQLKNKKYWDYANQVLGKAYQSLGETKSSIPDTLISIDPTYRANIEKIIGGPKGLAAEIHRETYRKLFAIVNGKPPEEPITRERIAKFQSEHPMLCLAASDIFNDTYNRLTLIPETAASSERLTRSPEDPAEKKEQRYTENVRAHKSSLVSSKAGPIDKRLKKEFLLDESVKFFPGIVEADDPLYKKTGEKKKDLSRYKGVTFPKAGKKNELSADKANPSRSTKRK